MLRPVRRIVTGHDPAGRSIVLSDGDATALLENPNRPGRGLTDLWVTRSTPARNDGAADNADGPVALEPPAGGSVFRFFQIMPESVDQGLDPAERERRFAAGFAAMGASHARRDTSRHPGMHTTDTVDYIVLLVGEVTLILDQGEVDLKPFDVVVQRGTNHAWANRGSEPAVLVGVLIDAEPV